MMTPPRRLSILTLTALVLGAVWACSADGPTGVDAARQPSLALSSAEEQQLKQQEQREKDRIAREQERSKVAYDSLKLEWERLNKAYPNGNPELLYCDPLQYTADVKIVGPEGADMSIGPHKLSIPKGALKNYVVITGEMPVSMLVEVKLSPHGLTFVKTPKLTLSYKHCNRPTYLLESVAYVDNNRTILEWPLSRDNTLSDLVDAWLKHFSTYAVAYRSRQQ